jgi:beta-N-acetylhexosaminidase
VERVRDAHLTRRRLLVGAGSAVVAAGLSACGSDDERPPSPPRTTGVPTTGVGSLDEGALRRKIASLLVVGFRGERLNDNDWIVKAVRGGLGGVILFDRELKTEEPRNITSPDQTKALVKSLREASPGRLIVSVDQEGGRVSRLNPSNGFPASKSEEQVGAENSKSSTRSWAEGIVRDLTSVGVNLNYAPVVDLNLNPNNPAIGELDRSFSADPGVVAKNAAEEIDVHRDKDVKTSIKHFPGLGTATGNTDFAAVDVSDTWREVELEPFQTLIHDGKADSVLVAHLVNRRLDPDRPASLSRKVVTDLLRGRLGFRGPAVSDDMQAVAITSQFGRDESVALALEAGLDLLVFANQQTYDPNVVDETLDNVVGLVRSGRLTQARINEAVARVDSLRPKR